MKCRLKRELKANGRVYPAGAFIDAPQPFLDGLVKKGIAEWTDSRVSGNKSECKSTDRNEAAAPAPKPVSKKKQVSR